MECKAVIHLQYMRSQKVLIETLWNVKGSYAAYERYEVFRINRNIVECKDSIRVLKYNPFDCINRNIVECKEESREIHSLQKMVLIETLWNVKKQKP